MIKTAVMTCWAAPMKDGLRGGNALWSLSALCARQHFDRLILFADEQGQSWLCDGLGLPFDEVNPLTIGTQFQPLWALGKIFAYHEMARRREPFVHIDGDACLLSPLSERLLAARMIAEMAEEWLPPYYIMEQLRLPATWTHEYNGGRKRMWNCGIFGGNDLDCIGTWATLVLRTVSWNEARWSRVSGTHASMMLEQWSLAAHFDDYEVQTLFPIDGSEPGYVHLKEGKFSLAWRGRVERELTARFPDQARRIGLEEAA